MGIGSSLSSALGAASNVINQRQPSQAAPQPMGGKGAFAAGQQQPQIPQTQTGAIANAAAMNSPQQAPTINDAQTRAALMPQVNQQMDSAMQQMRQRTPTPLSPQPMGGKGIIQAVRNAQPAMQQPSLNPFNQPQFTGMFNGLEGQQNPYAGPTPPGTIGHFGIDQYGRGAGQGFGGPPPNQGGMPSPFNPYAAPAQQPMFDQFTTQAEFDRARGMTSTPTPPTQVQPQQPQANPMMDLTGQQAMQQQRQMMQQQMMNRMYGMGGKGGVGIGGGSGGGSGGGFNGISPYARNLLKLGYMYKDGGEVKK